MNAQRPGRATTIPVYWNGVDNYVKSNALVSQFITALTKMFMTTQILTMPFDKQMTLTNFIKMIFLDIVAAQNMRPNAIYRAFLMNVVQVVHDKFNSLTPLQIILLRDNISYLEQNGITYFMPLTNPVDKSLFIEEYTKNNEANTLMYNVNNPDEPLIANSLVWEILQSISKKRGITYPANFVSTTNDNVLHEIMDLGNNIHKELHPVGRVTPNKTRKNRKQSSPYARTPLTPCRYGSNCRHQNRPEHTSKFTHSAKGGNRKSRRVHHNRYGAYRNH
jgi:hypothetical protein